MQEKIKTFEDLIKQRLKPKRYQHSLNVAKSAKELAKIYGADEEKAYICGVLHDVMKNTSEEEQLEVITSSGRKMSDLEKSNPKLWHAMAGAAYIQIALGINDKEMIQAIDCHTTAKANMTMLEKIIYIADYISDDRDYDGVEEMRKRAFENIDSAVLMGTQFSILDLAKRCMPIHPNTMAAYNEMCTKVLEKEM